MQKFLKYMRIEKMPILELEDKSNPLVIVNSGNNTITYYQRGAQTEAVAVRTSKPLTTNQVCAYFEIQVKTAHRSSQIAVGLINKDCAMKRHPGQSNMSFGYKNNGGVHLNRIKKLTSENFAANFRVGVGINYVKKQFFITNQGQYKVSIPYAYQPLWNSFYPCASVKKDKDKVQFHFDENDFKFPFQKYLQKSIKQCEGLIKTQSIPQQVTYKLVGDFLQFNGYTKSYKLFSQHSSPSQYLLKKHPNLVNQKQIFAHQNIEEEVMEQEMDQKVQKKEVIEDDKMEVQKEIKKIKSKESEQERDKSKQKRKDKQKQISSRQRSMSQYWNMIVQSQNQEFQEDQLLFRRKSSLLSLNEIHRKSKHIVEKNDVKKEDQFFLRQKRIQIINDIRQRQIQRAQRSLEQQIPHIFQSWPFLKNYFKMHKLFKIIEDDGIVQAIKHMRQNKQTYSAFKKQSFPMYIEKDKKIALISFQDIAGQICKKQRENNDISKDQFQAFAYIVNQLILSFYGLQGESKLELLINHVVQINKKTELYHIGGMIFDL